MKRGFGEVVYIQHVAPELRPERPERPEMRGNARASYQTGLRGKKTFHALLGISGRSGRSGRDPPCFHSVINGLALTYLALSRAVTLLFQAVQAVNSIRKNNMLLVITTKPLNIEKEGRA